MEFFEEEMITTIESACICDDQSCVSSGCDPNTCDG